MKNQTQYLLLRSPKTIWLLILGGFFFILLLGLTRPAQAQNDGNDSPQSATQLVVPHTGDYDLDPESTDVDWYPRLSGCRRSLRF